MAARQVHAWRTSVGNPQFVASSAALRSAGSAAAGTLAAERRASASRIAATAAAAAAAQSAWGDAAAAWAAGQRVEAHRSLDRAREVANSEPTWLFAKIQLDDVQARIGRGSVGVAKARGELTEELTDRELDVLRALRGPLSTREIGRELYLSINTVKGYSKNLYRKLGVVTRSDAVRRGRELGLI